MGRRRTTSLLEPFACLNEKRNATSPTGGFVLIRNSTCVLPAFDEHAPIGYESITHPSICVLPKAAQKTSARDIKTLYGDDASLDFHYQYDEPSGDEAHDCMCESESKLLS